MQTPKPMKNAFTQVELIFVIVIIAIVASVIIPKIMATKEDARMATAASDIAVLIGDIGGYYSVHGNLCTDFRKMTNVPLSSVIPKDIDAPKTQYGNDADDENFTFSRRSYLVDGKPCLVAEAYIEGGLILRYVGNKNSAPLCERILQIPSVAAMLQSRYTNRSFGTTFDFTVKYAYRKFEDVNNNFNLPTNHSIDIKLDLKTNSIVPFDYRGNAIF